VTNKILGTPCIVGKIRRKFGENFKVRVPNDPSAIVEPKILGIETLGIRGIVESPQKNLKERQGYARISLEIDCNLIIEPIQRFQKG